MNGRDVRGLIGGLLILAGAAVHFAGFIFGSALGWSTRQQDVLENALLGLLVAHPFYVAALGSFFFDTRHRRWAKVAIVISFLELAVLCLSPAFPMIVGLLGGMVSGSR